MSPAEELAKEVWKLCPNIDKHKLAKSINTLLKESIDEIIDDPYLEALFSNEGYYLVDTPNQQYRIYRPLIDLIPDNWSVYMPGHGNKHIYDAKGVLQKKYWKLPALRTKFDIELIK